MLLIHVMLNVLFFVMFIVCAVLYAREKKWGMVAMWAVAALGWLALVIQSMMTYTR